VQRIDKLFKVWYNRRIIGNVGIIVRIGIIVKMSKIVKFVTVARSVRRADFVGLAPKCLTFDLNML
jgi:hypothetical protein